MASSPTSSRMNHVAVDTKCSSVGIGEQVRIVALYDRYTAIFIRGLSRNKRFIIPTRDRTT